MTDIDSSRLFPNCNEIRSVEETGDWLRPLLGSAPTASAEKTVTISVQSCGGKRLRKHKTNKKKHQKPRKAYGTGRWSDEEHKKFIEAIEKYGNVWTKVEAYVKTRSCAQIRSHCQKYFLHQRLNKVQELRQSSGLRKALFVVTREYRNYSATKPKVVLDSILGDIKSSAAKRPAKPAQATTAETEVAAAAEQQVQCLFPIIDPPCEAGWHFCPEEDDMAKLHPVVRAPSLWEHLELKSKNDCADEPAIECFPGKEIEFLSLTNEREEMKRAETEENLEKPAEGEDVLESPRFGKKRWLYDIMDEDIEPILAFKTISY